MASERECGKPGVARLVWPTMEKIDVCEQHKNAALNIANAMGFRLGEISVIGEFTCTQKVSDE